MKQILEYKILTYFEKQKMDLSGISSKFDEIQWCNGVDTSINSTNTSSVEDGSSSFFFDFDFCIVLIFIDTSIFVVATEESLAESIQFVNERFANTFTVFIII